MRRSLPIALILLLSACSITPPDDSPRVAYRQADSVQSLAVPPDLTRPQSPDALQIDAPGSGGSEVLPEFRDIRMVRAGPLQWLEVDDASPDELWPRMSGFLRSEGLTIGTQRPAEGVIETTWAQRFDAVPRGGLSGLLQNLFSTVGSDAIRDKYQIRLERMDGGGTRVFLTHWMAQEVNTSPNTPALGSNLEMIRSQPDPAIAAEMRRRLLVYLGVSRTRAEAIASGEAATTAYAAPVRLVETGEGAIHAEIGNTDYRRALVVVAESLRMTGIEVTEIDEGRGNIWVRWLPPEDLRGGWLFRDDRPQRLLVRLQPQPQSIRVVAGDAEGNIRSGAVQVALLERLVESMGGDTTGYRRDDGAGTSAPQPIRQDTSGGY
ncbi:MAG: outer membrane protein assembly factor BamC [Halofilum sp. (in: g-proteobacteria)]|nr:outer membrane protein assembly factor BamC [Halofilum sp. (in: g-proteobacteria)]